MSDPADGEMIVDIVLSEDQSRISLIVSSPDGSPISKNDMILAVECWLHEVTQAELKRAEPGTQTH